MKFSSGTAIRYIKRIKTFTIPQIQLKYGATYKEVRDLVTFLENSDTVIYKGGLTYALADYDAGDAENSAPSENEDGAAENKADGSSEELSDSAEQSENSSEDGDDEVLRCLNELNDRLRAMEQEDKLETLTLDDGRVIALMICIDEGGITVVRLAKKMGISTDTAWSYLSWMNAHGYASILDTGGVDVYMPECTIAQVRRVVGTKRQP